MNWALNRNPNTHEAAALAMLLPVVDRLAHAVEAENLELTQSRVIDYNAHSLRKSQGLLELSRLRGSIASLGANPIVRAALSDLSAKLDVNRRLLHVQLLAARTVSSVLARAIKEGQSDGTYSAYSWRDNEI